MNIALVIFWVRITKENQKNVFVFLFFFFRDAVCRLLLVYILRQHAAVEERNDERLKFKTLDS